jgi:Membrane proteins related to metalloendopeptidases
MENTIKGVVTAVIAGILVLLLIIDTPQNINIETPELKEIFIKIDKNINNANDLITGEKIDKINVHSIFVVLFYEAEKEYTDEFLFNFTDCFYTNDFKAINDLNEVLKKIEEKLQVPAAPEQINQIKQTIEAYKTVPVNDGVYIWPVPHTKNITSPFGARWGRMHRGIDIAGGGDMGKPIVAALSGIVERAADYGDGFGLCVIVDHGNGTRTLYAHASQLNVVAGQPVKAGDVLSFIGSTGNSTGPHLHFEIIIDGTHHDPLTFY